MSPLVENRDAARRGDMTEHKRFDTISIRRMFKPRDRVGGNTYWVFGPNTRNPEGDFYSDGIYRCKSGFSISALSQTPGIVEVIEELTLDDGI